MADGIGRISGWIGLGLLAGCEGTGPGADGLEKALNGTKWSIVSAHETGWRSDGETRVDVDEEMSILSGSSIEFKSDKSFSLVQGIFPIDGTWRTAKDSVVTIVDFGGESDTVAYHVRFSGDTAVFSSRYSDDSEDVVSTMKAVKR